MPWYSICVSFSLDNAKMLPPVAGVPSRHCRSYMVCLGIRAEEGEPGMMLGKWKF